MPAQELPYFDSLVTGNDYHRPSAPTSDATSTAGAESSQIPNLPQGQPSPVTPVSLATMTELAPPTGTFQSTNLHQDNWLDPMKPHVSTEPQK